MKLHIIALFKGDFACEPNNTDVHRRSRGGNPWVQVKCDVREIDGRHMAVPRWLPPDTAPAFRVHLVVERTGAAKRQEVALVLKSERDAKTTDPEQRIIAPIFSNGQKLIYEFTAAEIMFASRDGAVEVREIALDAATGHVGTRTVYTFHGKFAKLAARCASHLLGSADLYPAPPPRRPPATISVPGGLPNLSFATSAP